MKFLGDDWIPGPDGLRCRHAARILVFDPAGRLLLARGHDLDDPSRHWWFTIGGGQQEGEDPRLTAVRELWEETGIRVEPDQVKGPVLTRAAVFDFAAEVVRQHEKFYLTHLTAEVGLDTSGWTEVERAVIVDLRWWDLDDLAAHDEQVYPEGLAAIARDLREGWDGGVLHLGDVHDPK